MQYAVIFLSKNHLNRCRATLLYEVINTVQHRRMGLNYTVGRRRVCLLFIQLPQAPAWAQWNKPHQDSTDQKNLATHLALSVCREWQNWTGSGTDAWVDVLKGVWVPIYTHENGTLQFRWYAIVCMDLYMFITLLVVGDQLMIWNRPASSARRWSAPSLWI